MEAREGELFPGKIKSYYPLKGYGFITREKGKDLFFFRTAVEDESSLIEGASVQFSIEASDRGLRAVSISRRG